MGRYYAYLFFIKAIFTRAKHLCLKNVPSRLTIHLVSFQPCKGAHICARQEFQGKPTKKRNVATHYVNGLTETNDYAVCHSLFITLVMGKRHSSVISNLPGQRAIFHLSVIIVMLWHYSSSSCSLQKFLWCLFS